MVGDFVVVVVYAGEETENWGDAEEVVGVGEESHPGDDYGFEMVVLGFRGVQRREHLQRHGGCKSRTPPE